MTERRSQTEGQGTPIPLIERSKWVGVLREITRDNWRTFLDDEFALNPLRAQDEPLNFLLDRLKDGSSGLYYAFGFLAARRVLRETDPDLVTIYPGTRARFERDEIRQKGIEMRMGGIYYIRALRASRMLSEQNLGDLFSKIKEGIGTTDDAPELIEFYGSDYVESFVHGMADMYTLAGSKELSDDPSEPVSAFARAFAAALMEMPNKEN